MSYNQGAYMKESVKTILLVEDDEIISVVESEFLKKENYNVVLASDGKKAIEAIKSGSIKIDLILMDIDLGPGTIDGIEAAKVILKNCDIPILFLSSHKEQIYIEKLEDLATYGYVDKNSGTPVLLASVKMAFKLHSAYRELKEKELVLQKKTFELNERIKFETLLADLTAAFINLPTHKIDIEIKRGLEWVVKFLDIDHGAMWESLEDQTTFHLTYFYGFEHQAIIPIMETSSFPCLMKYMQLGEIFMYNRVDDLSEECVISGEKETALKLGLKSNLSIPLKVGDSLLGVLGFHSYRSEKIWPVELIPRLKLIGEVFTSALMRMRLEDRI